MEFFIPGNTPSSKNSKRLIRPGLIISSEATLKWKKATEWHFAAQKRQFLEAVRDLPKPLKIGFHPVRDSKRKFDFGNICQAVWDAMTEHGWIPDDNMDEMVPFPVKRNGSFYTVDKAGTGMFITVLP